MKPDNETTRPSAPERTRSLWVDYVDEDGTQKWLHFCDVSQADYDRMSEKAGTPPWQLGSESGEADGEVRF